MAETPLHSGTGSIPPRAPPVSSIVTRCPRCGGPVEDGFAATFRAVHWVRQKGILDAADRRKDKLVFFADASMVAHVPGVRCRGRGLVVLDTASVR